VFGDSKLLNVFPVSSIQTTRQAHPETGSELRLSSSVTVIHHLTAESLC